MFYAIAVVLCITAFCIMSRPLKWGYIAVLGLSLGYAYHVKFHTYADFDEFKNLVRLFSLNTGYLVLGAVLGLLREGADDHAHYQQLRSRFLRFVCKWGAIYLVFTVVMTQLFNVVFDDESAGFIIMMVIGKYLFAACLLVRFVYRALSRKEVA